MKNWKTTFAGALAGAILIGINLYQTGTTDPKVLAQAIGLALVGLLAKDFNNGSPKPLNPTGAAV